MTPDTITAARAQRARQAAKSVDSQPFAASPVSGLVRLDLDGFVRALQIDVGSAVTLVAREARRADRQTFETARDILSYLESQQGQAASSSMLEKRCKVDSTAARPDGREVKLRLNASLPTALLLCGMESMRGGVSQEENDDFSNRVGQLMERANVKPGASIQSLADVIKLAGDKLDLTGSARALAGVGMTLDHVGKLYDERGDRRNTGPASQALDVIGRAVMMAHYEDKDSIKRALAAATAKVVESEAYAAEYIDPSLIMAGAAPEALAKAQLRAKEIAVADFPFTLTNMLAHHGLPGDQKLRAAFPADTLAALSMAGHNGINPVPGFPRDWRQGDPGDQYERDLPLDVPFASGQTPRAIIDRLAQRMENAPLNGNGDFEEMELRRIANLMSMRSRAGQLGALRLFDPVVKVLADRGQPLLYDADTSRPDVISYLIKVGHGNPQLPKQQSWRKSPIQYLFDSIVRSPDINRGMAESLKVLIAAGANVDEVVKTSVRRQDLPKFVDEADKKYSFDAADFHHLQFTLGDRLKAVRPAPGTMMDEVRALVEASQALQAVKTDDLLAKKKSKKSAP